MWQSSRSPLPAIGLQAQRPSSPTTMSNTLVPHKQSDTDASYERAVQETANFDSVRTTDGDRHVLNGSPPSGSFSSTRLLYLESRMNANEQAYRGVLEELVRLQSEVRTAMRRSEDQWKEERRDRVQLREGLQVIVERLNEAVSKIGKVEERGENERRRVHSLTQHVERLDVMVVERQRMMDMKQDQQKAWNERHSQTVESVCDQVSQFQEQVDRKLAPLSTEIKQWKAVVSTRKSVVDEWMARTTKSLEHAEVEQKDMMEAITHLQGRHSRVESSVNRMRNRLESRWNDLGEVLKELRRSCQEVDFDRQSQEEQLRQRLNVVERNVTKQAGQHDDAIHSLNELLAERELQHDVVHQKTAEQVATLAEHLNKTILDSEAKLKDDVNSKLLAVENALKGEVGLQSGISKEQQSHIEQQLEAVNRKVDDQVAAVRNGLKMDRVQVSQSLNQLHEAVSLIESQADIHSDNLKRVIQAEIRTRHHDLEQLQQQCTELQGRLHDALAQLQQSMATVSGQMTDMEQQVQLELKKKLTESQEVNTRQLGDVEVRLVALTERLSQSSESHAAQFEDLRQKVKDCQQSGLSSLSHNHTVTQNRVRELHSQLSAVSNQVTENVERLQLFKMDVNTRLVADKQLRIQEGQALRRELGTKVNQDAFQQMNGDAGSRLAEMEGKLAQAVSQVMELETSLHTLKLDLNGKVSSEATMRVEMVLESKERLSHIESQLAQLEFLIHHGTAAASKSPLMPPQNSTDDTNSHDLAASGHKHVEDRDLVPEKEQMLEQETSAAELSENCLPSLVDSHQSEPVDESVEDITPHESELAVGHENEDVNNGPEPLESLSQREQHQEGNGDDFERTKADQLK